MNRWAMGNPMASYKSVGENNNMSVAPGQLILSRFHAHIVGAEPTGIDYAVANFTPLPSSNWETVAQGPRRARPR